MRHDPNGYGVTVRFVVVEGENRYEAQVVEFPDLILYGETEKEAVDLARDAIETSIQLLNEQELPIPAPEALNRDAPSGRVTLRIAKYIHAMLIREAQKENLSLNSFISTVLTEAVARRASLGQSVQSATAIVPTTSGTEINVDLAGALSEVFFSYSNPDLDSFGEISVSRSNNEKQTTTPLTGLRMV